MALGKIISIKNVGRFLGWSYTSRRLFQKYAIEFDVAVSFRPKALIDVRRANPSSSEFSPVLSPLLRSGFER